MTLFPNNITFWGAEDTHIFFREIWFNPNSIGLGKMGWWPKIGVPSELTVQQEREPGWPQNSFEIGNIFIKQTIMNTRAWVRNTRSLTEQSEGKRKYGKNKERVGWEKEGAPEPRKTHGQWEAQEGREESTFWRTGNHRFSVGSLGFASDYSGVH